MSGDMSLGRAVLVLTTDNAGLSSGVDAASGKLSGFNRGIGAIRSGLSALGPMLAGAFAASAIINAGKAAIDYAGNIADVSKKLAISTDTAQEWEATFGAAGVSLESVSKASQKLALNVVSGEKSAVSAIKKLGFSLEEVRAMKPEERLIKVADAVGKIQDEGEKLYASNALFGKGGAELLSALDGSLGTTIDKMRDMGLVMSEETIAAADDFGDQLGFLSKQGMALIAEVLTPFLPLIADTAEWLMFLARTISSVLTPVIGFFVKGIMLARAELFDFLAGIAEQAGKVPILSRYLGDLGNVSGTLREKATEARERVAAMGKATETAGADAVVAKPKLLGFGDAADHVDKSAEKAEKTIKELSKALAAHTTPLTATTFGHRQFTDALLHEDPTIRNLDARLEKLTTTIRPWGELLPGVTLKTHDWAEAHEKAAETIAAVNAQLNVMPRRAQTAAEAYRAEMAGMGDSTETLGTRISGFFTNIPKTFGDMQAGLSKKLSGLFGAAPDSMFSSVISGGLNFVFGPAAGLATKLMTEGMEALGGVVWKGLKKIAGFFKSIFGGPSADELAGREVVSAFESNLDKMLTDQQRIEAGGETWKATIIAIRDKYIEMGLSEEEALKDAERLWKSSKEGAEASKRIIEEIQRKFGNGVTIPINFDVTERSPSAPTIPETGLERFSARPSLFLSGTGSGDAGFSSRRTLFTTGAGGGTAILELGGRQVAEVIVPEIPGVIQRYGLR